MRVIPRVSVFSYPRRDTTYCVVCWMWKEESALFHDLNDHDLHILYGLQKKLHAFSSEYDALRLFAWLPLDATQIAYWRNCFVLRCHSGDQIWYLAPHETEDFQTLLFELEQHERQQGATRLYFYTAERDLSAFPAEYAATDRRDLYDYLYRAQDLVSMQGRAYAAKRNQIAQFKRKYQWRFEPISPVNTDAVLLLTDQWDAQHNGAMLPYERTAVERMLHAPDAFGQSGGLLFADDQPAAFAIGSHTRAALLDVLAEKALPQFIGAYSAIIQMYSEYAYSLHPFEFINREEDMGLENLRNAKLQLKPDRLIAKTLMSKQL